MANGSTSPYPHVPIDQQLANIAAANVPGQPKHVHILGSGIAGLVAAQTLSGMGHEVTIFEASDRVGGRIFTYRFGAEADQMYGELGAMRIPASHDYTLHFINQQKLAMRRFITLFENDKAFYDMRGVVARMYDRSTKITPRYRLSEWEKTMAKPDEPGGAMLFGWHLNALIESFSPDEIAGMFAGDMFSRNLRQLDSISLYNFIRTHAVGTDAVEYMGNFTGLQGWPEMSVGMFLRDTVVDTSTGLKEVIGGLDLLPRGIAGGLPPGIIQFGTEVIGIANHPDRDKVELIVRDSTGQVITVESECVLCTIPFPVLRQMSITGFTPDKVRAISTMNYAPASKVILYCKERFWETKYGIFGGASASDGIARWTYYPSDHADENSGLDAAPTVGARSFALPGAAARRSRPIEAHKEKIAGGPGVLLASYALGKDAVRQGTMHEEERVHVVKQHVARFHPEILEPGMVLGYASMAWDSFKWSGGAFGFMLPDELSDIYQSAIAPEGRMFFAGEHCSTDQAWIQGALISSLRAVLEIVKTR